MPMKIEQAIQAIEEQQKQVKERGAAWMVGEQLKDICRREPASAEILAEDLAAKEMSITEAEKKIKAFADKHRVGKFACVTPVEADGILREFYGLGGTERAVEGAGPYKGERTVREAGPYEKGGHYAGAAPMLDLADFL